MIRINLLPQRRKASRMDKGQQAVLLGGIIIVATFALIYIFYHRGLSADIDRYKADNKALTKRIQDNKKLLEQKRKEEKQREEEKEREQQIKKLTKASVSPAYALAEIARILTPNKLPTMTELAKIRLRENRNFRADWQPKGVWLTQFEEKEGKFTITGGAQTFEDATQFKERLDASVYFQGGGDANLVRMTDKDTTVSYYQFKINGTVVY